MSVPQPPNASSYYAATYTPSTSYAPATGYSPATTYTPTTGYTPATGYTPTYTPNPQLASLFSSYAASYSFTGAPQLAALSAAAAAASPPRKLTGTGSLRPSSPVQATITSREASQAVQRLIASELQDAGFDGAKTEAVYALEMEIASFVQNLYQRAHEYANLANRSGPIATDLLLASEEFDKEWSYDVSPKKLASWTRRRQKKEQKRKEKMDFEPGMRKKAVRPPSLIPPPSRSPSPELLQSDDEMDTAEAEADTPPPPAPPPMPMAPPTAHPSHLSLTPSIPVPPPPAPKVKALPAMTLRNLPGNLPSLPPKHTYLQTPPPTKSQAAKSAQAASKTQLSSSSKSQNQIQMEKKLRTASLVQESLKNLLLATEDTATNQEDAELLGHIVNWESTLGVQSGLARKRWRV
ncbi:hypothetical protein D9757_000873 [Collybiopsis confluens]|uniref:Transcription initiation factor TFIID subunit 8 n=1 Tax=Collybiopsis confluens TaxID=2823264 RepID=A0A8H5MGD1_9AGAR|nr:hypothetical protein D9757_000873 [Collybiopsis confluens]